MRLFSLVGGLFFLFVGVNGFVQIKNYTAAKENGQDATVIVKKKYTTRHRGTELKVSYRQKDYWVRAAQSTFDSSWFNKTIILKYDAENDTMIDESASQDNIVASIILMLGGVLCCCFYFKKD